MVMVMVMVLMVMVSESDGYGVNGSDYGVRREVLSLLLLLLSHAYCQHESYHIQYDSVRE
jgi:hypothetical protein